MIALFSFLLLALLLGGIGWMAQESTLDDLYARPYPEPFEDVGCHQHEFIHEFANGASTVDEDQHSFGMEHWDRASPAELGLGHLPATPENIALFNAGLLEAPDTDGSTERGYAVGPHLAHEYGFGTPAGPYPPDAAALLLIERLNSEATVTKDGTTQGLGDSLAADAQSATCAFCGDHTFVWLRSVEGTPYCSTGCSIAHGAAGEG